MMPKFTRYEEVTGEIIGQMDCSIKVAELNKPYINGSWDSNLYRVVDGKPVRKPDDEIEANEIKKAEVLLRTKRNNLLSESDWTQVPDAPLTETQKAEWRIYRQKLRDLPANTEDPRNVIWPTKPSG